MTPPFYPARPINGGPLDKALPKSNGATWFYEPKLNDWRALLHRETGAMFNRKLEPLSIAGQFGNAYHILHDAINDPALDWLNVMCLGRRIPLGKGSIVLLDAPEAPGDWTARQERLHQLVEVGVAQPWAAIQQFPPPENSVLTFAYSSETVEQQARRGFKPDADTDQCQDLRDPVAGHQQETGLSIVRRPRRQARRQPLPHPKALARCGIPLLDKAH